MVKVIVKNEFRVAGLSLDEGAVGPGPIDNRTLGEGRELREDLVRIRHAVVHSATDLAMPFPYGTRVCILAVFLMWHVGPVGYLRCGSRYEAPVCARRDVWQMK